MKKKIFGKDIRAAANLFLGLKNDRHGYGMKRKIFGKDIRAAAKFADWDFAGRHLLAVRWGIH